MAEVMMERDVSAAGSGSQPAPAPAQGGGHYLAKCVLRGSAVLHAVRGRLRSLSSFDIVFGKETSLELVVLGEDGVVQSVCEQTVFGTIKDLAILRWNTSYHEVAPEAQEKDILVVLSDSGKLSFLSFCPEMHRFFAITHIQISKPGNSRHQLGRMVAVHSHGSYIAVSAFEDLFAIYFVSISAGGVNVKEKIFYPQDSEVDTITGRDASKNAIRGTIWSMCFVSKGPDRATKEGYNPTLAVVMHRKGAISNELFLFVWNRRKQIIHVIAQYSEGGPLALSICEVPHLPGFALLFRFGDVLLMNLGDLPNICCVHRINFSWLQRINAVEESYRGLDPREEGLFNFAACALLELRHSAGGLFTNEDPRLGKASPTSKHVCSWCWEPGKSTSSKLICCLDTGELCIIDVHGEGDAVSLNVSDCLYRGFPCKALLWVEGGLIAGLIEMGDGMVLKLERGGLSYKSTIQNISPILDMCTFCDHEEKQDKIFACCGTSPQGSLRIIRSGISAEKLLKTSPTYQGITGIWSLKMKESDMYDSFLVLSFVEETRVLSVGLSFVDVSDATGFQLDACTLACGLVADGLLVQIHKTGVKLCVPTTHAHREGAALSSPVCTSWCLSSNLTISMGAVAHDIIIVAASNPCLLFILGIQPLSQHKYEIYEMQYVRLLHEVSCISIPHRGAYQEQSSSATNFVNKENEGSFPKKSEVGRTFVVGTHKPSVEIFSFLPGEGFKVIANGIISINNAAGTPKSGCVPEDVRLVSADRSYVLSGLRNGMLLRFEWPVISSVTQSENNRRWQLDPSCFSPMHSSSVSPATLNSPVYTMDKAENSVPILLQLIAIRRIGITPVSLVPLHDSLDADIIVLSNRPWLLHTARHSLAYTSISFQPATHATPMCSVDCPKGIFFVAENSLHLVEMIHSKRLNVQKYSIEGTPRKVLYHSDSKSLLVMRTGLNDASCSSDICRVDPMSGTIHSQFKCDYGETAKCMELIKVGNEQVLVVGTTQSAGRTIMLSGEAESSEKGRLIGLSIENVQSSAESNSKFSSDMSAEQISSLHPETVGYLSEQLSGSNLCSSPNDTSYDGVKLQEVDARQLRIIFSQSLAGAVLSVCLYLDRYVLASAGNSVNVFGFLNENPQRIRKFAVEKTRFTVTCLTTYYTRIAVGDCRDGILFYSYSEDARKLEQLYSDPVKRLVGDCTLMDLYTAVVSDRRGSIGVLSCVNHLEGSESPEKNLLQSCSFYIGEAVMSIWKGSFSYKLSVDDVLSSCNHEEILSETAYNSIVASTLLGSVLILFPISREEHDLLEAVQGRLAVHPLTSPILGNDHKEFRKRGSKPGVPTMLDADMLGQFLELTTTQQEDVLASSCFPTTRTLSSDSDHSPITVNKVVWLLERFHYALN